MNNVEKSKKLVKKIFFVTDVHWFKDNRVFKSIVPFLKNKCDEKDNEDCTSNIEYSFEIYYQYKGTRESIFSDGSITYVETTGSVYNNESFFRFFTEVNYDVLYLHNVAISEFNLLFDALRKDSVIIFDCHEYIPTSYITVHNSFRFFGDERQRFVDKSFKKFLDASHGVIVVSEIMKKLIMENFGVPERKILKFTNFAPMWVNNVVPFEKRRKEIAFVGTTPRNMNKETKILESLSEIFKIKLIGLANMKTYLRVKN
ncbi:MAG: glycosyltransferase family 4 protein [Fervidobacterium sp.]